MGDFSATFRLDFLLEVRLQFGRKDVQGGWVVPASKKGSSGMTKRERLRPFRTRTPLVIPMGSCHILAGKFDGITKKNEALANTLI